LNSNQTGAIEKKNEEKEVRLQTLNKSFSISTNKSKNISFAEEKKDLTGVQKFVRIFNYDQF
jgi:hypothetical protein